MLDDVLHFASNNSSQSDHSQASKMRKLEARLVGKSPSLSATHDSLSSMTRIGVAAQGFSEQALSSDSDDDNGDEYLVQAHVQKRKKPDEDEDEDVEAAVGMGQTTMESLSKPGIEGNRRRQGRGRGNTISGRGRGSRANGQMKTQNSSAVAMSLNEQFENSYYKDGCAKERFGGETASLLEVEVASLRAKNTALEEKLRRSCQEASEYQQQIHKLERELKDIKDYEQHMKPKRTKILSDLLISVSRSERQEARLKVRQDSLRLGNVGVIRAGTVISETWEDGPALKDLNIHLKQLLEMKEGVERQRKSLKKRQSDKNEGPDSETGSQEEDFLVQDEIYKARLASIKREEDTIFRERDRYDLEKTRLIREMKRIRDEDGSRFNSFPILNNRYALLNLLGKGGFSEVYKAYDLVEQRYVACKLHGLNAQWSEEKKQSYMRHAIREYNIHKTLVHNHIVRLWDIFEIDQNAFCTILEYCSGKDLDAVLKATPVLPEKEARIIIVQIFQGLVYLNKRTQKIIHYDLKPGNVLFDMYGVAKVTDFGLSKIVEDDVGSQGMELTSQGAGTYWYLPPECFELYKTPLISSKVDVWSAGVLLYQMLFGKRPFGHDQTQERILREDTIIKARKVEFPSRPSVSNEAKEFIRRCLSYNQADRPDVLTIAQDPYITYAKK